MAYKNKHIVNFGLFEKDYQFLMFLFKNSHCSFVAEFFRFCLRDYYSYKRKSKSEVDVDSIKRDVISLKDTLFECMGVIKHD